MQDLNLRIGRRIAWLTPRNELMLGRVLSVEKQTGSDNQALRLVLAQLARTSYYTPGQHLVIAQADNGQIHTWDPGLISWKTMEDS